MLKFLKFQMGNKDSTSNSSEYNSNYLFQNVFYIVVLQTMLKQHSEGCNISHILDAGEVSYFVSLMILFIICSVSFPTILPAHPLESMELIWL